MSRNRMVLPFGVKRIDAALPGGLAPGALHEVAGDGRGAIDGAAVALFTAGIAARTEGKVLWCVTRQVLFAPALAQAGPDPVRVIYVEAGDVTAAIATGFVVRRLDDESRERALQPSEGKRRSALERLSGIWKPLRLNLPLRGYHDTQIFDRFGLPDSQDVMNLP